MSNSTTRPFNSDHDIADRIRKAVAAAKAPLTPSDIFTESELEWIGNHFAKRGETPSHAADVMVRAGIGMVQEGLV